jgi:hypothetical protein
MAAGRPHAGLRSPVRSFLAASISSWGEVFALASRERPEGLPIRSGGDDKTQIRKMIRNRHVMARPAGIEPATYGLEGQPTGPFGLQSLRFSNRIPRSHWLPRGGGPNEDAHGHNGGHTWASAPSSSSTSLQSLIPYEAGWLDTFYLNNITPLFFVETLADLAEAAKGRPPEQIVGSFAYKTPPEAYPNVYHATICLAELLGYPNEMCRVPVVGGRVVEPGDRRGLFFALLARNRGTCTVAAGRISCHRARLRPG